MSRGESEQALVNGDETSPLIKSDSPVESETTLGNVQQEDIIHNRQISCESQTSRDLEYEILTASGSHIIVKSGEFPPPAALGATTT